MKWLKTGTSTVAAIAMALLASGTAHAAPSEICDTAALQAMAPEDTTVAFAAREFGGGCRVHGYVTTRDPGPNRVLFVLMLPDNFNGRYLYVGVGGAAGVLPYVPAELYRKGYAIAGSDGGSGAKTGADFSFQSDPGKATDFAWRGVHVSAAATQRILETYYRRAPSGRYITGCSGGGQMGLTNALKFGRKDFDGFIVGATPLPDSAFMPNIMQVMRYIQTHPEGWISPELAKKADAAILARYDSVDGAKDGVIADARDIADFDLGILRGVGFTPAQIATFDVIRGSRKYSALGLDGSGMQPGFPVTNVTAWTRYPLGRSAPPWPSTADTSPGQILAAGASFFHVMIDTMVRAKAPQTFYAGISDPRRMAQLAPKYEGERGDFATFGRSGAKMIIFHGVNDEAMSYLDTMKSYQALADRDPQSSNWLRVFPVAGLMHCRGGIGPTDAPERLLDALADWVEKDLAPQSVVTTRVAAPYNWIEQGRPESFASAAADSTGKWDREFLLCPEPMRVRLKAPGLDPVLADNWSCKLP